MTGLMRLTIIALTMIARTAALAQEYELPPTRAHFVHENNPNLFDIVAPNNLGTKNPFDAKQRATPEVEPSVFLSFNSIVTRHDALSITWAQPETASPVHTNAIPVNFGLVYSKRQRTISQSFSLSVEDRDARDFDGIGLSLKGGIKLAF